MAHPFALTCPNCGTSLSIDDRFCSGCGMGLDTLTLLLDSAAPEPLLTHNDDNASLNVPRLGEFLVARNFISQAQLDEALVKQRQQNTQGSPPKMLGEVLVETGAMTSAQMQAAISEQIVSMQSMLRQNNRMLSQRVAERTGELEGVLSRMKEVSQLKVNFLSNISHELRTPLTQIQGYIAMFYEGMLGELNPQQTEAISETMKSVVQLRTWIDELIQYTMMAKGELSISPVKFSLSELATSVVERSKAKAEDAAVQLVLDTQPEVWVRGDMEKLSWVLLQLVDNGIKFTHAGGMVTLRVTPQNVWGKAVVDVSDTGIGIEPERIPDLFEPVRAGASAQGFTGRGLGLVLVRRILAAHEVQVTVQSRAGAGTIFSFELNLAS